MSRDTHRPDGMPSASAMAVSSVLARPGHEEPLGATRLHLVEGRIAHLEDTSSGGVGEHLLAIPGLANAHDHGRGLRSVAFGAADAPLELWITRLGAEPLLDPYLRAAPAFARMAESGICATNHCHNTQDGRALLREAEGVARAAHDVGIRVAFAVPFVGRNPLVYGDEAGVIEELGERARTEASSRRGRTLAEGLALVDDIATLEGPCFLVQYGPVGPQWTTEPALRAIAERSAASGRRVHMHLFETHLQREWADAQYPGGLVAHLDDIGMLSERLTLAHAVWLRPREAELLASRGVTVSLNASSNLRLRSGLTPAALCRHAGLAFGIGLDGMSLDDDDDMLREIRLLRHLANAASPGNADDAVPLATLFDAAFVTGRRTILGEDGGGRLMAGAPADLLLLDLDLLTEDVVSSDPDLTSLLWTRMSRRHVRGLVVAGRTVVEKGHCVTVDRAGLERELLDQARHARAAHPIDAAWQNAREQAIQRFYMSRSHMLTEKRDACGKKPHG